MNIKDRTIKMKLSNLFFNRSYSNSILVIIISFALINYVWGSMGHDSFDMMSIFLINFIFVLFSAFGALGPGEALKEPSYSSDTDRRDINKSDFNKMGIYLTLYAVLTLGINTLFAPKYIPPKPTVDKHVQIKSVKFIDIHEKGEDKYAIRYYDSSGQNIFTDVYTKEPSRLLVYKKIFDSKGKVIVDIDYYNRNGKPYVEISAKAIQL